ncbi:serine/threonine phosphatase [Tolypothrix sp. FACHB-123]|uniref:serine/threonine phosphatase n=1 Tax=Tolypothrix sp. FACHB-123 TaxID=2692868 RepID=UPI0016854CAC|nr:serine/threonine phosphatase [Tolypothrix sp. FACHB-123]MBD2353937.1 serine/threonine phosphatase [Tolypothrix sp. FACHB-123]
MLICPQCKFENSNTNKFCQNCGASLTQKFCPECSTSVPINAQNCPNCGADCGTVWWAIIAKQPSFFREIGTGGDGRNEEVETDEGAISSPSAVPLSTTSHLVVGSYLDPEQRYQLLEPLPTLEELIPNTEVCIKVLDCHPYQIAPLAAMLENHQKGLVTPSVAASGIPLLAKPYIALQAYGHPGIPEIHDAWQQGDIQVVLIQDRSNWPRLLERWQENTTSSLQILHWCYQMTQLWTLLEPVNCCPSLLDLSNLLLDEDQTLTLGRLYTEPLTSPITADVSLDISEQTDAEKQQPLTIQALGRVWQALFRQSQRTQFGSIVQMLGDLELGKIETMAQLRSRLEEMSTEIVAPTVETLPPTQEQYATAPTMLQVDELENLNMKDDMPTVVLPMQLSSLQDAGQTDVGRQRHHNEDFFGIESYINKIELPKTRVLQARGLYILCDGMGGHAGGEVASELAVNTIRQYFQQQWTANQLPTEDEIRQAVYLANQAIYDLNQKDARSGVGRMGTTLVMLLIQDSHVAVAHVGDSRLYCVTHKRGLEQITIDHEVGQREISRGVEASIAYARPDAYQLTQALGPRDENSINPDVDFFEINEDTLFLLASDGLSDNDLLESHWQSHLVPLLGSGTNLEAGVTDLIDLANQYNGHDNITAILIRAKVRPNLDSQR